MWQRRAQGTQWWSPLQNPQVAASDCHGRNKRRGDSKDTHGLELGQERVLWHVWVDLIQVDSPANVIGHGLKSAGAVRNKASLKSRRPSAYDGSAARRRAVGVGQLGTALARNCPRNHGFGPPATRKHKNLQNATGGERVVLREVHLAEDFVKNVR